MTCLSSMGIETGTDIDDIGGNPGDHAGDRRN
jgi:hypothetical protein